MEQHRIWEFPGWGEVRHITIEPTSLEYVSLRFASVCVGDADSCCHLSRIQGLDEYGKRGCEEPEGVRVAFRTES